MEDPRMDGAELVESIDLKTKNIRTKSLDISFNELLDMYEKNELIIRPEYQRLFRWSEGTQSRFIESLLIELPIPPIFVIERTEGVYELIDGLQRISSYMHFRGRHPERINEDGTSHYLELIDCDIVKDLNGLTFNDLPKTLQIKLRRNFTRVEVIRKESDSKLRYHIFKRLNSGGYPLTAQEMRNCTIRILDNEFIDFLMRLSENDDFNKCLNLSDERYLQRYDEGLVLRFFAFKNNRDNYIHDVEDFMTEYAEGVAGKSLPFDYLSEKYIFEKTFRVLNNTLDVYSFTPMNQKGQYIYRFSSYHFEAFTLGIQKYLPQIDPLNEDQITKLRAKFIEIKTNQEFRSITAGGGKNSFKQLQERIEFVEKGIGIVL
jgi:uncharacterized protein with ParB-like and HNH nuclease domain